MKNRSKNTKRNRKNGTSKVHTPVSKPRVKKTYTQKGIDYSSSMVLKSMIEKCKNNIDMGEVLKPYFDMKRVYTDGILSINGLNRVLVIFGKDVNTPNGITEEGQKAKMSVVKSVSDMMDIYGNDPRLVLFDEEKDIWPVIGAIKL